MSHKNKNFPLQPLPYLRFPLSLRIKQLKVEQRPRSPLSVRASYNCSFCILRLLSWRNPPEKVSVERVVPYFDPPFLRSHETRIKNNLSPLFLYSVTSCV